MLDALEKLLLAEKPLPLIVKDHLFDDILNDVHEEATKIYHEKKEAFERGAVGGLSRALVIDERGDLRCWLTPNFCSENRLSAISTLVKRVISWCKEVKQPLQLNGEYSVQLTCYPGNGARYVKHRDAFHSSAHASDPQRSGHRKLTFVCYLNKEWEGGHLRAHFSPDQASVDRSLPAFIDVEPLLGRVLGFRGDIVEHEVMPSFKNRFAITLWAYSDTPGPLFHSISTSTTPVIQETTISQFLPTNYSDSEGLKTITHLFSTASHPERIFVGHVYQGSVQDHLHDFSYLRITDLPTPVANCLKNNIRVLLMPRQDATGPCLARQFAQRLWKDEEYFLQIDSHMRFRPNWDEYLINLLEHIENEKLETKKAVLTTYPIAYNLPDSPPSDYSPTILIPTNFGSDGILRQSAKTVTVPIRPKSYFRSPLWASGFSFSRSCLIEDVEYSSYLPQLFFGEESLMAARLFTAGYDFFAPGEAVLYHLYSRDHRPVFSTARLSDHDNRQSQRQASQEVVRILLGEDIAQPNDSTKRLLRLNRERFPMGSERSLDEFEAYCGVSFAAKSITRSLSSWQAFFLSTKGREDISLDLHVASDICAQDDEPAGALNNIMLELSKNKQSPEMEKIANLLHKFLT
eukprot:scaffold3058_cov165-Ochromonas_danica.AAC.33